MDLTNASVTGEHFSHRRFPDRKESEKLFEKQTKPFFSVQEDHERKTCLLTSNQLGEIKLNTDSCSEERREVQVW